MLQDFGEIKIGRDKITTPNGIIPLNVDSDVLLSTIPFNQYAKKAAAVGIFVAGIFTGGAVWVFAPAGCAVWSHKTYYVSVITDKERFLVTKIKGVVWARDRAIDLNNAIVDAIKALRAEDESPPDEVA